MKRNLFSFAALMLGTTLLFSACTKDKSTGEGAVSYQIEPSNFTASVGAITSGSGLLVDINSSSSLTWKTGHIIISELNFEAKKGDHQIEYKLVKPVTIDLFKLSQQFGSIQIPAGIYNEIEFKVELKKATNANMFSISGVYTDETGIKTPVEFNYNEDLTLTLEVPNLTVSSSTDYNGLLTLQLNKLVSYFNRDDFKLATKNANGAVIISSTSNVDLFNKIKTGFVSFAKGEFKH